MLKKILSITAKIIAGIFIFYLFLGFLILPAVISWAIKSKGTQILKHPVSVRSVRLNPLSLSLGISGFAILDADKQVMAGFDRFFVDASFISLLKKKYRVESLKLDGLKVNAILLPDGRINLLDLVPKDAGQPDSAKKTAKESQPADAQPAQQPGTPAVQPAAAQPLPLVTIDDITLQRGTVSFRDQSVTPNFLTTLSDIDVHVTGASTSPDCQARVVFQARLDDKGIIATEALFKPFVQPLQLETSFTLNDYGLGVLTPYVGKYTGRAVKDGKLDLKMDYRITESKLTASHSLLVQRFDFGDKVASKDALNLPFGLALALLEDPRGRISISLPVTGDVSDPEFRYFHLIVQVAKNFFLKLVTKPFAFLASAIGSESGTEELGYVRFVPGKAELSDAEKAKITTLVKGLQERPKLSLEVNGSYDPEVDWKAIKIDVFNTDYQALKEESKRVEDRVYQELYQRRFGIRSLWQLTGSYKSKEGVYDYEKLNAEIKRRLIEDAPADKVALNILAQTRATIVYDYIISAGFDSKRVSIGENRQVQASLGYTPLEFTLTVFDVAAKTPEPSNTDQKPIDPAKPTR